MDPLRSEPALGLTRSVLAFLLDAYAEDEAPNAKGQLEKRTVLRLDPRLAPVKAAVLPLSRHADLSPVARDLASRLPSHWSVDFDDAQAIGRRYRRQDEIGTPFCITVDFDTLADQAVTIRERDSMRQDRVGIDQVSALVRQLSGGVSSPSQARLPSVIGSAPRRWMPRRTPRRWTRRRAGRRSRRYGCPRTWSPTRRWCSRRWRDHRHRVSPAVPAGDAGRARARRPGGLFVSEMITSRALVERNPKTLR